MKTMYKVDYTIWVGDQEKEDRVLDHDTWMYDISNIDDARTIALSVIDMYIASFEDGDFDIRDCGNLIAAVNTKSPYIHDEGIRIDILTM